MILGHCELVLFIMFVYYVCLLLPLCGKDEYILRFFLYHSVYC